MPNVNHRADICTFNFIDQKDSFANGSNVTVCEAPFFDEVNVGSSRVLPASL